MRNLRTMGTAKITCLDEILCNFGFINNEEINQLSLKVSNNYFENFICSDG